MSAREHVFMLQNCASECVNNRTYRTLQETCDEGAPCSSGQGSEALIGSLHIQALPTNRQKTRTCCCTCSCYKILCCNMPSDKNFLRKRACVRPRFKEHCAAISRAMVGASASSCRQVQWLTNCCAGRSSLSRQVQCSTNGSAGRSSLGHGQVPITKRCLAPSHLVQVWAWDPSGRIRVTSVTA